MTTSSLTSTEVALSKRLRILCTDYENRPYVVKRGVLATLIKFLSHDNLIIAVNAAESLHALSEHPENPTPMCRERTLLPALSASYQAYITMAGHNASHETLQAAAPIGENSSLDGADPSFSAADPSNTRTCAYLADLISKIVSNLETSLPENTSASFCDPNGSDETSHWIQNNNRRTRIESSVIHQTRNVVLDIPSLAEENVNQLASLLETIRGIISFTIDFNRHVVRLLLTTPTPTFLRILDENGFISIILLEENVQQNNFHHIDDENAPQYIADGEYRGNRHGPHRSDAHSSLVSRGKRRYKSKRGKKHSEKPNEGLLGRLASWF